MMTIGKMKKGMLIALMALMGTTAFAQHRHYGRIYHNQYHRPVVATVVTRPAVSTRIVNRLSRQERLDMAVTYLKNNAQLTVSKYSSMTGLTKATAEAELDVFAHSKKNPVKMVVNGKKKYYVLA